MSSTPDIDKCEGCGTQMVHADDCPALDPPEQPSPCTRTKPHPPHKYMLNRTSRPCPGVPEGKGDLYLCPTVGEIESAEHGGFRTCCAHPEQHVYLGYSTPVIEVISQYLSDRAREEYSGPLVHPGQEDPTTIKMPSNANEARQELLRLQVLARSYRDAHQHLASHRWAETIHTEDDGLLHIPVYNASGSESEGLVMDRENAVTLQAMLTDFVGGCWSGCDDDCDIVCHEVHAVPQRRHHPIGEHPSHGTALDHVTTAIARHDMVNLVGLEPHQDLPEPDHDFWTMWRNAARTAITAYNGYIEHTGHRYLSTGCRHGEHGYCQSNTGSQGQKIPAVCKFCQAPCVCSCHALGAAPAPAIEQAEAPQPKVQFCMALPPGSAGSAYLTPEGEEGTWGDCDCTKPKGHKGEHACEPCTKQYGAPTWPQETDDRRAL